MFGFDAHDPKIENALLLAYLAEVAYSEEFDVVQARDRLGFSRFTYYTRDETQVYVFDYDDFVVVAFRGTEPDDIGDWQTDAMVMKQPGPLAGFVHRGFLYAFMDAWEDKASDGVMTKTGINSYLWEVPLGKPIYLCGHSLGGALATLCAAQMVAFDMSVKGVYTFGSPRVGDLNFASEYSDRKIRHYRFVNNNDVVCLVPPISLGYHHVGLNCYINEEGTSVTIEPSTWYSIVDRMWGRLRDVGTIGTDGIKDHGMRNSEGGYIPALERVYGHG